MKIIEVYKNGELTSTKKVRNRDVDHELWWLSFRLDIESRTFGINYELKVRNQ